MQEESRSRPMCVVRLLLNVSMVCDERISSGFGMQIAGVEQRPQGTTAKVSDRWTLEEEIVRGAKRTDKLLTVDVWGKTSRQVRIERALSRYQT